MNGDGDDPEGDATRSYGYDGAGRVVRYSYEDFLAPRRDRPVEPPATPAFAFEHDEAQGVFRLTWPDGKVEVFRDRPARQLRVEPDATGAMRPVVTGGQPVYLYLAREEREGR